MEFKETKDKLIIEITPPKKAIVKFGLVLQGVLYIGFALFLFITILPTMKNNFGFAALFFIAISVVLFLAGRKFLNNVSHREILEVTKKQLIIIDQYLLSRKVEILSIPKISNIEFIGQQDFTKHPLDSETMDYTGFGTTERMVQSFIADGTISVFYNGKTRRFGKNLPSWDAEEIIVRIAKFTGNNLSLDDEMEKLLDELDESN